MSFSPYPKYKPSGVEWLGDIPEHWEVVPTKRLFDIVGGSTPSSGQPEYWDGDIQWVTPADLSNLSSLIITSSQRTITEEGLASCGATLVPTGSIVLSTRAPIGSLAISGTELCTNQGCKSLVAHQDVDNMFYAYVLLNSADQLNACGKGTTFLELSGDALGAFPVLLPSAEEQQTIAVFLNRETAKIDALVEDQNRLIELLQEKRQAIITHVVSKGLNPNVPMKPSGVEWLGDIPDHWGRVQLGKVCLQVSDGPHFSPQYLDEGIMFLSARNIKVDGWSLSDAKYISEQDFEEFSKRVTPVRGDVLYTKGGTTGVARVVDFDARFQVWVHVAVLKIDHSVADPFYVAYALNSSGCYEQSQLYTRGATNNDLGLTRMTKIWLALPPLQEQLEVVKELDRKSSSLDLLVSEAEKAVLLLQERRSSLISAAVTGKIDVQGAIMGSEAMGPAIEGLMVSA